MTNPERPKTTRQVWIEHSNEVQEDVDRVLQEFHFEIEAANSALSVLYKTSPAEAYVFAQKFGEYLNERWPYKGDVFFVSGHWHEPTIVHTMEGINCAVTRSSMERTEVLRPATSNGFKSMAVGEQGSEVPRMGLSFFSDQPTTVDFSAYEGKYHPTAFAEFHEISMQYMRPGDESVVSTELGEVVEAISRAERLFAQMTGDKTSKFYTFDAEKQYRVLLSLLDVVNNALPTPDSLDAVMVEELSVPRLYIKTGNSPTLATIIATGEDAILLSGKVLGVTVHDIVLNGPDKKYHGPEDFMATAEGLSLVVQPSSWNLNIDEQNVMDAIVPLKTAQNVNLQVV